MLGGSYPFHDSTDKDVTKLTVEHEASGYLQGVGEVENKFRSSSHGARNRSVFVKCIVVEVQMNQL